MRFSRRAIATLGILAGTFLAAIEATIVATAMPTVVGQLGGLDHYSWVFAAYMLTSTVTVPLWGKLADLYGRRPFYITAVALFLLGSGLSGAARSLPQLIAFRAIQGLGAGGLIPLGMTILGDLYTPVERGRVQGAFSGVWGIASVIGPLAGGYLTEALSWRWIFYLNVPFGIFAGALVSYALVEPPPHERPRVDYLGAILLTASLTLLLVALTQTGGRDDDLSAGVLLVLYGLALVLGAGFALVERRTPDPLIPPDLFASRLVTAVTVCGFFIGLAMFGAITFVPLFVQAGLGGSATKAGSALTPLLLGWVALSILVGRVFERVGYRRFLIGGLTLVTCGFVGLTQVTHMSWLLYGALGIMGMGLGMTMLTLLLALQGAVGRERLGVATSLGRFMPSIGGAVGVAIMGTIVAASVPAGQFTMTQMQQALHRAFAAGIASSLAALVAALWVPPELPAVTTRRSIRAEPRPTMDHPQPAAEPRPLTPDPRGGM